MADATHETTESNAPVLVPSAAQFAVDQSSITNNHGMLGECAAVVEVAEKEFIFSTSLHAHEPDSSSDARRSKYTLTLKLEAEYRPVVPPIEVKYEYRGDGPGDHLAREVENGNLFTLFASEVRKRGLRPADGFLLTALCPDLPEATASAGAQLAGAVSRTHGPVHSTVGGGSIKYDVTVPANTLCRKVGARWVVQDLGWLDKRSGAYHDAKYRGIEVPESALKLNTTPSQAGAPVHHAPAASRRRMRP